MLRLMGIDELVVADSDDYVRLVADLARDPALRESFAERIRQSRRRIFDDTAPVVAFTQWLRDSVPR